MYCLKRGLYNVELMDQDDALLTSMALFLRLVFYWLHKIELRVKHTIIAVWTCDVNQYNIILTRWQNSEKESIPHWQNKTTAWEDMIRLELDKTFYVNFYKIRQLRHSILEIDMALNSECIYTNNPVQRRLGN